MNCYKCSKFSNRWNCFNVRPNWLDFLWICAHCESEIYILLIEKSCKQCKLSYFSTKCCCTVVDINIQVTFFYRKIFCDTITTTSVAFYNGNAIQFNGILVHNTFTSLGLDFHSKMLLATITLLKKWEHMSEH